MSGPQDTTKGAGTDVPAPSRSAQGRTDPPLLSLSLWPNRSLSPEGFRFVMALTGVGLLIPLVPFLGTPIAWGLIPFMVGALLALYAAIQRSYADGALHEELRLWPDLITVDRIEPRGRTQHWEANPYWVTPRLHENARIESYLTLKGGGREIELGSFLSPDERVALHRKLVRALPR